MANETPDTWTQADAVALRTFIANNPKFMMELWRRRPKIEGNTMESRAVTGSDCNGFFQAIDIMDALQKDPLPSSDNAGHIESGE